jgi:predicted DNA-binding transcriptional regulator AlpA
MSHPHAPEAATSPQARPTPDDARPRGAVPIHERLAWDLNDLEALTGISRRSWERWKSAGKLPRPIRIGRRVLWPSESIRRWLQEQAAGREAGR